MRDSAATLKSTLPNAPTVVDSVHACVIIIVGGSIIKRKLLETSLSSLNYKHVGIVHITRPIRPHSARAEGPRLNHTQSWDPRTVILAYSSRFQAAGIIPLIDSVVGHCDSVSAQLKLPGNDPLKFEIRVDKEKMQSALMQSDLPHAPSLRVSCLHDAISAWKSKFSSRPVVLKPPRSGGCDGVAVCASEREIACYLERYLNKLNLERLRNSEIVMQEFLQFNSEYIVNSVSVDGLHFITDVWNGKSKNSGSVFIYDTQELVTDYSSMQVLLDYTKAVLTTTGVRYGACHTELGVQVDDSGKIEAYSLIEVNPRVAGEIRTCNSIPNWNRFDQVYWLILSIVDPTRFLHDTHNLPPLSQIPPVVAVFLRNPHHASCHLNVHALGTIRKLPSFSRFGRGLTPLNDISDLAEWTSPIPAVKTVDLISSPGVVLLVGETAHTDTQTIREIEANSLYVIAK